MKLKLNAREEKFMRTPKQREIYIMQKFIWQYKFGLAYNHVNETKAECFRMMNEVLVEHGYKPKKHVSSVHKLWDVPFFSHETEYFDECHY
ncbi:hypothetical protein V7146_11460 [Gottfriedia acidiceleris]|uniref:hypothetical protein n=1 Tax=Gottfriedia acidiceleris TaxID=371036 RepID=UPI0030009BB0